MHRRDETRLPRTSRCSRYVSPRCVSVMCVRAWFMCTTCLCVFLRLCVPPPFPCKSLSLFLFVEQSLPAFLSSYPCLTHFHSTAFSPTFHPSSFLSPSSPSPPSISLLLLYPLLHLCFEVTTRRSLSKGASRGPSAFSQQSSRVCEIDTFVSNWFRCQGIQPVRADRTFKQHPL